MRGIERQGEEEMRQKKIGKEETKYERRGGNEIKETVMGNRTGR